MQRILKATMLVGVAVSLAAIAGLAEASGNRAWHQETGTVAGSAIKSRAVLYYGVPQTDDITIAFSCDLKEKTLSVRSFIGTRQLSANQPGHIKLRAGNRQISFDGMSIANEESGAVDIRANEPAASALSKLRTLFESPASATIIAITTPGADAQVPSYGASTAFKKFEKRCLSGS
jgi:hypothetical protein